MTKNSKKFEVDLQKWKTNEERAKKKISTDQESLRRKSNDLDGFPTDAKVETGTGKEES